MVHVLTRDGGTIDCNVCESQRSNLPKSNVLKRSRENSTLPALKTQRARGRLEFASASAKVNWAKRERGSSNKAKKTETEGGLCLMLRLCFVVNGRGGGGLDAICGMVTRRTHMYHRVQ